MIEKIKKFFSSSLKSSVDAADRSGVCFSDKREQ